MKKILYILILIVPFRLIAETVILETINVNAQEEDEVREKKEDIVFQKEGYMKSAPMQQQLTTKQALKIAGTNGDVVKAIKTFAGVVSTNNDNGSEIFIHGSKPRETLFTLNHLPLGYLFHLGGLHSVIAPEMVEQMDAYLGGFDVTYGAMGAVVDISPKYPTGSKKGRLHIGLYDADFAYDASLGENTSLFIGARRSYFDLIATKVMDELDKDDEDPEKKTTFKVFPRFYDGQFILTHNIGNNIFSIEALISQDELKIRDTFNKDKDPKATGKIESKVFTHTVGLRWLYLGDDFSSNTLIYRKYIKNKLNLFEDNYFVDTSNTEYGLYNENTWHLKNHTLTFGVDITQDISPVKIHITDPTTSDFDAPLTLREVRNLNKTFRAKEIKVFAQDIWDITANDHFRYGLRAWKMDFQKFDSTIDPRVAYVHDFKDDLSVSMAIGKYSQFPNTLSVIPQFGNEQIDTFEFSNHYTMSFAKKFSNGSSLVIEPYFKTFENLTINDEITQYEAIGKGEAYGVDITYKQQVNNFNFILAYTFVKAKRQIDTNSKKQHRFVGDIPHTLQMIGSYDFANDWSLSGYFKYNQGKPYTPIVERKNYTYKGKIYVEPIYGTPYSKRLPDNYDLDIQIAKTIHYESGESLEFSVELLNLTALIKPNISSIKYDDNYEEDGEVEQLGFLPAIHMTYRF